ncbi:hypothetical protein WG906_00090 [Pedobacter sp. P351]
MKKIVIVLAVAAIGMVSCKKESEVKPVKVENATMGGGATSVMLGMD